jgi:glycosyltransferase involved in cell wall biosynthesis
LKKILYITYDGLTDPLGQSQVLPYLTELSKHGFQFTILSFEKRDRFSKEKNIVNSIIGSVNIRWIPLRFTSKPPVLSKMYDRWRLKQTALRLCKKEKFDLIHCRSYVAAEVGLRVKQRSGTKFLFDMRGFWADEKVDNRQWNLQNYLFNRIYRYYKKKERQFLLNADAVITLTQRAKDYLLAKPEYKHLSIRVIPCCADLDHFSYHNISAQEIDNLKQSLQIPATAKIITYTGSVGGWYMTKEMFSFFRMLVGQKPEYFMLVLTKDNSERVTAEALAAGIPGDKIFVTYSNREKLPKFLALSDCGIFFIRNTFSKMASSPTKHAEMMGMGIPIICNDIGDTGNIVKSTKTGIVVEDFTNDFFQQTIEKMSDLERIDPEYVHNCAKEIFDLNTGVQSYLDEYNRILN